MLQKLVGSLWLTQSCNYFSKVNMLTKGWDDEACNATLKHMIHETVARVCQEDPVKGNWCVSSQEMGVWVDASSLTTEVALKINGDIVEQLLMGINLALQREATVLQLVTVSTCTHRWIISTLTCKS